MSIKDLVLNKGWAGTTITRQATADRLNLLIRPLIELMYSYNSAVILPKASGNYEEIQQTLPDLRADIGKLSETIHSSGVAAFSGTELDQGSFASDMTWATVLDREEAFAKLLSDEKAYEHHIRTRAVLGALAANSETRRNLVKQLL